MNKHTVENIVLQPEIWQRHELDTRLQMAKRVYNRTRDAWLKRRRKYLQSEMYREAQGLDDDEARCKALQRARKSVGFVGTDAYGRLETDIKNELFGTPFGDGWCSDAAYHLTALMIGNVGGMAVRAVRRFHAIQNHGKPTPKADPPPLIDHKYLNLDESEAKVRVPGPNGGADTIIVDVDESYLEKPKIQRSLANRKDEAQAMICREPNDKRTPLYKAKITCNGPAPLSEDTTVRKGTVGVDVGPGKVAAVGDEEAWLGPILNRKFVDEHRAELRRVQRQLDRQRRANNPDKYDDDGEFVGPDQDWDVSNRQARTYAEFRAVKRVLLEERKRQHHELVKRLLALGNEFIVEDISYQSWQTGVFGAQVQDFAPSTFIDRLEAKARAAGGSLRRVSTKSTELSSRCHCGRRKDNDMGERWHDCPCGVSAQRDLYSAFLARHVDEEEELVDDEARREWPTLKGDLRSAADESELIEE